MTLALTAALTPALTLALALALTLAPDLAWSELRICNETSDRHSVAVGYKADGTWLSEGWWILEPGDCATLVKDDLKYR